jgi:uncharacterized membrane protein
MTNGKYYLAAGMTIVAALILTAIAYPHLPAVVATHWDIHGKVNGWAPKWMLFLFGPGFMALTVLLCAALPWLSPKKFEVDSFRATYLYIMLVLVALLGYCQILMVLSALGLMPNANRAILGGVCLLIALLGNVMGKVRRNFFVGVRTPWTLANEQVWHATHRFAAKTFVGGGLVGFLAVILDGPDWVPTAAITTAALSPVIYSLVFYKQLERRGEL